jgi:hypothetical protein
VVLNTPTVELRTDNGLNDISLGWLSESASKPSVTWVLFT